VQPDDAAVYPTQVGIDEGEGDPTLPEGRPSHGSTDGSRALRDLVLT